MATLQKLAEVLRDYPDIDEVGLIASEDEVISPAGLSSEAPAGSDRVAGSDRLAHRAGGADVAPGLVHVGPFLVATDDDGSRKLAVPFQCVRPMCMEAFAGLGLLRERGAIDARGRVCGQEKYVLLCTAAILFVNADHATSWALRRSVAGIHRAGGGTRGSPAGAGVVVDKDTAPREWDVPRELAFVDLIFSKHPKSAEAWSHRLILVRTALQGAEDAGQVAGLWRRERGICERAATMYPKNYHAWNHRRTALQAALGRCREMAAASGCEDGEVGGILAEEAAAISAWTSQHVADHSGVHHALRVLEERRRFEAALEPGAAGQARWSRAWIEEYTRACALLDAHPGHEALWQFRRGLHALAASADARGSAAPCAECVAIVASERAAGLAVAERALERADALAGPADAGRDDDRRNDSMSLAELQAADLLKHAAFAAAHSLWVARAEERSSPSSTSTTQASEPPAPSYDSAREAHIERALEIASQCAPHLSKLWSNVESAVVGRRTRQA